LCVCVWVWMCRCGSDVCVAVDVGGLVICMLCSWSSVDFEPADRPERTPKVLRGFQVALPLCATGRFGT